MTEIALARTIFLAFFVLLLAGVFFLPKTYVLRGAPDHSRWRDLRLWALALVAIHVVVYAWF